MMLAQGPPPGGAPPPGAPAGPPDASMIPSIPSQAAQDTAQAFVGVAISLNVLAFLVLVGRMWTRSFPIYRVQPEDWIICGTWVLIVVDTALLLLTVPFKFGRPIESITLADAQNAQHYAVLAQPIWAWSMAGIKISVCLMLLRLQMETRWRRILWSLMGFVVILTIYNMVAQLTQCIPLHKTWDLLGLVPGKCWGPDAIRANLFAMSTINVVTDFIVALIPITFLRKIQRPVRERAIIGTLMALGIFAGVASIVKMVSAVNFGKTNDMDLDGIRVGMWSLVEELVGFIAACVPCLRSPFQRCLEYFGLVSTHAKSNYGRGYGHVYASGAVKNSRSKSANMPGVKLKSLRSVDAPSEENILAESRSAHTGISGGDLGVRGPLDDGKDHGDGIWCTTEVYLEQEERRTPRSEMNDRREAGWDDDIARLHNKDLR
ncbi:hypothetical protein BU24DRAFT_427741 [Aaosphaeria arxii CBS 175.79]|uniref:Rhodopsin domain-containing protein n=1 Tax=Aaosphaeria arxii CBS 175.79 TaxID=1450172 RepID=A0A6A5XCU4_9PLEO|nr:uncharacterized protein BU24DRAFT_427741 [Aaosphaeria arxii CBS 175.79]KAF2010627.1 hypothetical protein BU24DRAFT_427741 [Aaosphaeria arxii CBS 175.79]